MSYQSREYAQSLAEFGAPRWLPNCRGWVLDRPIRPTGRESARRGGFTDATGCYPLFSCGRWAGLPDDLADLRSAGLVSLTLVTDPLSAPEPHDLHAVFPDLARPYKEHFVVDLAAVDGAFGSVHHGRNVARFLRRGTVDLCADPAAHHATWTALYGHLIARHGIIGLARFSDASFRRLLAMPELVMVRARTDSGETAGMQLWLSEGNKAWYHLGAYSETGYSQGGASAALTAHALDHFRGRGVRWANLGSGAGLAHDSQDGLSRFKRGWATGTRWAWLCGAVLAPDSYREACLAAGLPGQRPAAAAPFFFPAYRAPRIETVAAPEVVVHAHAD